MEVIFVTLKFCYTADFVRKSKSDWLELSCATLSSNTNDAHTRFAVVRVSNMHSLPSSFDIITESVWFVELTRIITGLGFGIKKLD